MSQEVDLSTHMSVLCRVVLLLVVLVAVVITRIDAAPVSDGLDLGDAVSQHTAARTQCVVHLEGTLTGNIDSASIVCSGAPLVMGFDQQKLGRFRGGFNRVTLDARCIVPGCVLSFCNNSDVLLRNSTITGISRTKVIND